MKKIGMTTKPDLNSLKSPIRPSTQGVRPKPMMPAQASRMKRIVELTLILPSASAMIVGQKQAVAEKKSESFVMRCEKCGAPRLKSDDFTCEYCDTPYA